ncbi:putative ribonuclease H-like domain-containing protein [Tanacetum coccineum]
MGYEIALESLESRILGHEKNELAWGQTNAEKPKSTSESVVSNPKINRDRFIIKDWNSDDEDEEYELQTLDPRHNSLGQKMGNPEILLQDHAVVDSGCSSHMTGNKAYLSDYEDFNGALCYLGSDPKEGSSRKDKGPTQDNITASTTTSQDKDSIEDVSSTMDDVSRQAFEEENRRIASQTKATQATRTNKLSTDRPSVSTNRPSVSTDRPSVSTDMPFLSTDRSNTPYVSAASTSTVQNAGTNSRDPTSVVQQEVENQKDSSSQHALVESMQEELLQFKLQKIWVLVDLLYGKKVIGTKWVFRNKRDERSIVVKNKARLVAQGFRQEEEDVYVHQPPGFVDPAHPNKVYKVIKTLYHQALRAWYETLSSFLMENGFKRGKVTLLFDSMLVQQTEDEGDVSKRPSNSLPIPSHPHPSKDQPQIQPDPSPRSLPTSHIPDSIPEGSGRNHGGQSFNDASLSGNEDGLTLQSVYDLYVSLCKQARLNADKILAKKLQEEEREMYTIEQRAKFLHDTIAAQRRFLASIKTELSRINLLQEII